MTQEPDNTITQSVNPSKIQNQECFKIAVSSRHGLAVDMHFGHCESFLVYEGYRQNFKQLDNLITGHYCHGPEEEIDTEKMSTRQNILDLFKDFDAVISLRIGEPVKEKLKSLGVVPIEDADAIDDALNAAVLRISENRSNNY